MKATVEAVLFYFNKIAEKEIDFSKKTVFPHLVRGTATRNVGYYLHILYIILYILYIILYKS